MMSLAGALVYLLEPAVWGQQGGTERVWHWADGAGNPAALVEKAQKNGIGLQYQYVHDLSAIPAGVPEEHGWFGRYTWTLSATMDFQKEMGWSGSSGYASMTQHGVEFGQVYDGVAQGYANLDTHPHTTLYEAWIRQQTPGGKLTLKAGRIDANADFDAVPTAAGFLNSSMGYSPTLMNFPSYPAPQPGVEVSAALGSATRVMGGEFRTPGGRMSLVEGDRTWVGGMGAGGGRAAVGMWHLTESLTGTDGASVAGTSGWYGVLEQSLWARPLANGKARTIAGFLQAGSGDGRVNPYSGHLGGGLAMAGPFGRRLDDGIGLAASWLHPAAGKPETVVEAYYKLSFGRGVSLVPDVQYFRDPGCGGTRSGAVVVTPRLVFVF